MNQLQGIKNYLVVQNGTIICHKCNDQVEVTLPSRSTLTFSITFVWIKASLWLSAYLKTFAFFDSHKCNDQVEVNDNKIIVDNASSLQIIYLIDQEGKYSIDLTIKGSLELIETYDLKTNATLLDQFFLLLLYHHLK